MKKIAITSELISEPNIPKTIQKIVTNTNFKNGQADDPTYVPLWNKTSNFAESLNPEERKLRKLRMTTEKINVESDKFSIPATFRFRDETTTEPEASRTEPVTESFKPRK